MKNQGKIITLIFSIILLTLLVMPVGAVSTPINAQEQRILDRIALGATIQGKTYYASTDMVVLATTFLGHTDIDLSSADADAIIAMIDQMVAAIEAKHTVSQSPLNLFFLTVEATTSTIDFSKMSSELKMDIVRIVEATMNNLPDTDVTFYYNFDTQVITVKDAQDNVLMSPTVSVSNSTVSNTTIPLTSTGSVIKQTDATGIYFLVPLFLLTILMSVGAFVFLNYHQN